MMLHHRMPIKFPLVGVAGIFLLTTTVLHLCLNQVKVRDPLKGLSERNLFISKRDQTNRKRDATDWNLQPPLKQNRHESRELMSGDSPKSKSYKSHSSLYVPTTRERGNLRAKVIGVTPVTASQRELFEVKFAPDDMTRVRAVVESLRTPRPSNPPSTPYDVYHCPEYPPDGYPTSWSLAETVLSNWHVDDTTVPTTIYQGLCVFDWEVDRERAETYRRAEVPFVVINHPEVLRTTERWNHPSYLATMIGSKPQRTDHSKSSRFMFWKYSQGVKIPDQWEPPTDEVKLTYKEWLERAEELQRDQGDPTRLEHWYLRFNAVFKGVNSHLYDELPVFAPLEEQTFFNVDPKMHPGINCRGGTKGAAAENHFDTDRNFIVLLQGQRRFIVSAPSQCRHMELYPDGHPSARHSRLDWSQPLESTYTGPFRQAMASEIVLQPGGTLGIL